MYHIEDHGLFRKQYNILVNVRKYDRLWFVPEFDIASLFGEIDLFNPQPTQPNPTQPKQTNPATQPSTQPHTY